MGKNLKKIMAITLSFTLAVGITGCSKGSGKSSMGRYVEERYESPTNGYAQNLTTLEDGRIAMFGYSEETSKESAFISEDGGILSNFPIWLFDVEGTPKWPTFGLKLLSDNDLKKNHPNNSNLITYSCDLIDTILANSDEAFLNNKDSVRTIKIRTYNIGTIDFAISKDQYLTLFNSGYKCAKEFLAKWNFDSYISRYRSDNRGHYYY